MLTRATAVRSWMSTTSNGEVVMGSMSDGNRPEPFTSQSSRLRAIGHAMRKAGTATMANTRARVRRWAVTACVVAPAEDATHSSSTRSRSVPSTGECSVSIKRLSFWPESRMRVLGGDDHATR